MKKHTINPFICILLTAVVATGVSSFTEPAEWQTFESKALGFSIKFPAKPQESVAKQHIRSDSVVVNVILCNVSADTSNNNILYMANHIPARETVTAREKKDSMYAWIINGIVGSSKGTIVSKNSVVFKGFDAEEVKINIQGRTIFTARMFFVDRHMYILGVATTVQKQDNADISKFFDSFQTA